LLLLEHFLEPEFAPTWRMISEYEIGDYGWVMRLAFFCWGAAYLSFVFAIWKSLSSFLGILGKCWLFIISIALFAASIYAPQPITDLVRGTADKYHTMAGAIMIFTFPIVSIILTRSISKTYNQPSFTKIIRWLTVLVWVGFLSFFCTMIMYADKIKVRAYGPDVLIGLPNRLMVVTYTLWLIVVPREMLTFTKHK